VHNNGEKQKEHASRPAGAGESLPGGAEGPGSDIEAMQARVEGLEEALERARADERRLWEINQNLLGELNLERLLTKIMDTAKDLLAADRCTLFLYDEQTDELWAQSATGVDAHTIRFPSKLGLAGAAFHTGETINLEDAYLDVRFNQEFDFLTGYHTRSILAMPVVNKVGNIIGVAQLLNKKNGSFTQFDENRLRSFCALAGIAIENARLYNNLEQKVYERTRKLSDSNRRLINEIQERRRAEKRLQAELKEAAEYVRQLLPPPIHQGAIRTDWRFIPCTSLGGDAFGYHFLPNGCFAVYLLDVSGHGVGAALLSVSVLNVLRSETLPGVDFRAPDQVCEALNEAFPEDQQNDMFFTLWYGVFDPRTRRIEYASGGHPPALIERAGEEGCRILQQLRTSNPYIGAQPTFPFQKADADIEPGDALYVYSDGVYEFRDQNLEYRRLTDFLEVMGGPHPPDRNRLDFLIDYNLSLCGGGPFDDDFSILEVRFE
jgi:serine phosphatase RsbU (regulator of sigma subunit)